MLDKESDPEPLLMSSPIIVSPSIKDNNLPTDIYPINTPLTYNEIPTPKQLINSNYDDDFPSGLENQLKLPFNLKELKNSICSNFRSGPLYPNHIMATGMGAPVPMN